MKNVSSASRWLQIGHKSEKGEWRHNFPIWHNRWILFTSPLLLLSTLIAGPSFMSISWQVLLWQVMTFFEYKGLARNLKIENTPVSVLPNIWRLGQVRDTRFDANVSNKITECCKILGLQLLLFFSY